MGSNVSVMQLLAFAVLLFGWQSGAAELVIYHDSNPSVRGWLLPRTQFVSGPSWGGEAHIARNVHTGGRAELGLTAMNIKIDSTIDWPSAILEFYLDPGEQVLKNCTISLGMQKGSWRNRWSAEAALGDLGSGRSGYRRITVPLKKFAASAAELTRDGGILQSWMFRCEAKAGTVFRIDEVRIIDKDYGRPPWMTKPKPVTFVREPAFANGRVTFEVSDDCDVAVHVLDSKGKVVRHLAGGVLGGNPPSIRRRSRTSSGRSSETASPASRASRISAKRREASRTSAELSAGRGCFSARIWPSTPTETATPRETFGATEDSITRSHRMDSSAHPRSRTTTPPEPGSVSREERGFSQPAAMIRLPRTSGS